MLEVEDLNVHYGTTHAVRDLSFRVERGDALALIGANGAGKTSALRAISRLVSSEGRVTFEGQDLRRASADSVARRGIIHVPEGRHVFPDLTVHENLQIGTIARAGRKVSFSFDDVYDLFPPLAGLRHRLGYALSGGEQQMVALGRALVGDPQLLLVDEPSLGLAPLVAHAVAEVLISVRSRMALVVVEQNTTIALRVCLRGIVLSDGKAVLEADASGLSDRDRLIAHYLGQEQTGAEA
jgi:branched-chain amino acid transport system ATP-binding protein